MTQPRVDAVVAGNRRPRELVVAMCVIVAALASGVTALWIGRHDALPATHFALADAHVRVPDVTGTNLYRGVDALHRSKLNASLKQQVDARVPLGQIVAQRPRAGTLVRVGSDVVVTIAIGSPR